MSYNTEQQLVDGMLSKLNYNINGQYLLINAFSDAEDSKRKRVMVLDFLARAACLFRRPTQTHK